MMRTLTRPVRVVRARLRTRRQRALHHAEVARGADLPARPDRTPIFILGAPRSGTTLLYQLLTEHLDVGYLANAHVEYPSDVSRVERERRPLATRGGSDFESEHGTTNGAAGPSEAGEFWYRFFPRAPHQVHAADATPSRTRELRAVVRLFADACGRPLVFKNVFNSLRIPVIAEALPEARFIVIERDLESNARSLLAGRVKRGDLASWWSARPDGADAVTAQHPARQVVWQAARMQHVAATELAKLAEDRSFTVSYAELCAEPARVISSIEEWLLAAGTRIGARAEAGIPQGFERRAGGSLAPELEEALGAALADATLTEAKS